MIVVTRLLAALVFLVAAAMLLLSLAGGVGVWIVKEPATAKTAKIFERIDAALNVADQGLAQVETSLTQAAQRLADARQEQQKLAQQAQPNNALQRFLARTVQQQIAPGMTDANQKLFAVAEAVVVINSVLEDVGNFPLLSVTGLDTERLDDINRRLADVPPAVWDLSRLMGETAPEADEQFSRIQQALQTLQGLVAAYAAQVTEVRQRTDGLKARVFAWITPAAAAISAVCFWIALSQLSLMVHACSWWKGSGRRS